MLNPTFASFKPAKSAFHGPLSEININAQPKTFHELKASNVNKLQSDHSWAVQPSDKICFNNSQARKPILNFNMKKNYSQANFVEI